MRGTEKEIEEEGEVPPFLLLLADNGKETQVSYNVHLSIIVHTLTTLQSSQATRKTRTSI